MDQTTDTTPAGPPVKDAATVLVCRDSAAGGIEVFMVRRHLKSGFMGGAFVFPGGKVDEADRAPELAEYCAGLDDATASWRLGRPSGGLAFYVAGVRECFEEAGLLLARPASGTDWVDIVDDDPAATTRLAEARWQVNNGSMGMAELCRSYDLVLDPNQLRHYSRWVTPPNANKRFDTMFFVTTAPLNQTASVDDHEATEYRWIRPVEALRMAEEGDMPLVRPTRTTLTDIQHFDTTADLLAFCADDRVVESFLPDQTQVPVDVPMLRRDETDQQG